MQIYGDCEALGLKFIGGGIDRPCQTTGGGYTPISIFNSGGTLTKIELSVIGMSIDMAGPDSATVIGGTNNGANEDNWFVNQARNFPPQPTSISHTPVPEFQDEGGAK